MDWKQVFAAWGFCWLELSFYAVWSLIVVPLLFPTTVSLFACFLSVNTLGKNKYTAFLISLLMILPTDIIHPMWKIIFNVCVCCTRANSLLLFSFFFLSRGSTSILRGVFQTLSREALLLDMTHEVRWPATAAVRSMSIDYICKTRN